MFNLAKNVDFGVLFFILKERVSKKAQTRQDNDFLRNAYLNMNFV